MGTVLLANIFNVIILLCFFLKQYCQTLLLQEYGSWPSWPQLTQFLLSCLSALWFPSVLNLPYLGLYLQLWKTQFTQTMLRWWPLSRKTIGWFTVAPSTFPPGSTRGEPSFTFRLLITKQRFLYQGWNNQVLFLTSIQWKLFYFIYLGFCQWNSSWQSHWWLWRFQLWHHRAAERGAERTGASGRGRGSNRVSGLCHLASQPA